VEAKLTGSPVGTPKKPSTPPAPSTSPASDTNPTTDPRRTSGFTHLAGCERFFGIAEPEALLEFEQGGYLSMLAEAQLSRRRDMA
jgi:hypothetical protein